MTWEEGGRMKRDEDRRPKTESEVETRETQRRSRNRAKERRKISEGGYGETEARRNCKEVAASSRRMIGRKQVARQDGS